MAQLSWGLASVVLASIVMSITGMILVLVITPRITIPTPAPVPVPTSMPISAGPVVYEYRCSAQVDWVVGGATLWSLLPNTSGTVNLNDFFAPRANNSVLLTALNGMMITVQITATFLADAAGPKKNAGWFAQHATYGTIIVLSRGTRVGVPTSNDGKIGPVVLRTGESLAITIQNSGAEILKTCVYISWWLT